MTVYIVTKRVLNEDNVILKVSGSLEAAKSYIKKREDEGDTGFSLRMYAVEDI